MKVLRRRFSADGTVGQLDPKDMMPTWELIRRTKMLMNAKKYDQALVMAQDAPAGSQCAVPSG